MPSEFTHRINDDEQNPTTLCGIEVLREEAVLATIDDVPTCDRCHSAEIATHHILTIKFHMAVDYKPKGGDVTVQT